MKKIIIVFFFGLFSVSAFTQELRCNVQVTASQIQGTNKEVFRTLQEEITEFMNNTIWTDDEFESNERIECKILLNLKERSGDEFSGSIQVSSRRPVYNSSYSTTLIQNKDNDLTFTYQENEPLEFDINSYKSNLTSILAYYAYVILGMDYDSFSPEGGNPHFKNAEKVVNEAQNSKYDGWKSYESRKNRYWFVENALDGEYSEAREFVYRYHREGLDKMHDNPSRARQDIITALELLQKVFRERPDPYLYYLNLLVETKSDEFINVFSEGDNNQVQRVYEILSEIDPSRSDRYEKITQR
ncbi:MAG: DUF4835 family protein [Bacteroidales bacterium]